MRKNSIKNTRINDEVQHELSNIIRAGLKDPRVAPMTSVVMAEVAPDLKTCKAYISVLGDEKAAAGYVERPEKRGRIYPQRTGKNSEYEKYSGDPLYVWISPSNTE